MGITLQGAGGHDGVIMRGAGVQTVFQRRFGRRTQVTARASYDELRYARVSDYNGPRGAMSLGVQHILSPRLKISGALKPVASPHASRIPPAAPMHPSPWEQKFPLAAD